MRRREPFCLRAGVWPFALLSLLAVGVYVTALPAGFVFDDKLIQRDPRILGQTSFWKIFVTPYWYFGQYVGYDLYRPLTIASYALNRMVVGQWAPGFHAVNVLLHAGVCGVLLALLRSMVERRLALAATLLFATHPIHTEAVAGVVGRAELLAALFLLTALFLHAHEYRPRGVGSRVWLPFALGSYFFALLSKESAIIAPALVVLLDLVKWLSVGRSVAAFPWRRSLTPVLAFTAVAGVSLAIRYAVLGQLLQNPAARDYYLLFGHPVTTRVLTGLEILSVYARLLFFPVTLSADYSYRQLTLSETLTADNAAAILTGLSIAVALALCFIAALRNGEAPVVLAIGFFGVSYSVVSNMVVPIGVLVGERLMYLPSAGFCLGIAWLGTYLFAAGQAREHSHGRNRVAVAALAVLLGLYSVRTLVRNFDWWTPETLYAATARASPQCHAAHYNYAAVVLRGAGDDRRKDQLALKHLLRANAIRDDHVPSVINLGTVYVRLGQPEKALETAERGLRLWPGNKHLLQVRNIAQAHLARRKQ
jgi:tetratricopeptide (TPR) repeat protein